MRQISASKQLAVSLSFFCFGVVIGSYFELPIQLTIIVFLVWGVIYFSGQNSLTEIIALIFASTTLGFIVWQMTGGESWLAVSAIEKITASLLSFREIVIDRVYQSLPEPHGSLMTGIIFGNRIRIDQEVIETFRAVGLSHLIAVSGYNLTIIVANLRSLLSQFLDRQVIWICIIAIFLFILITGAPASILRAGIMATIILIARYYGRPSQAINLLLLASGILIFFEPKIIFDVGFQLSVVATYAIMRIAPILIFAIRKVRLNNGLKQIFSETTAATLMTAPLIVGYFERLSLLSPLANILVVPIIPITMAVGMIGSAVSLINNTLGSYLLLAGWPLLEWIITVAEVGSNLRFSTLKVEVSSYFVWILLAIIIFVTELLWKKMIKKQNEELDEKEI